MKKIKEQRGITLVALIITIIVLLILAMVAIKGVQGDGIFVHAQNARDNYNRAKVEEKVKLALNEWNIVKNTDSSASLKDFLIAKFGTENVEGAEEGPYIVLVDGYKATIDKDGNMIGELEKNDEEQVLQNAKLTVSHVNKSGEILQDTTVEEYKVGTYVTVKSQNISGYEVESLEGKSNDTVVVPAIDGSPISMAFPIERDTNIKIVYKQLESGATNKNFSEQPNITSSSTSLKTQSVKENSTEVVKLRDEIKNEDDHYIVDIEPEKSDGPVTIEFDLSGKAVDGDEATVYHYYRNSAWENLGKYTVENSKITIKVNSFSPFYISIKHNVTTENVGFVQGWAQYTDGTWSNSIYNENELQVGGNIQIVAKLSKTGNRVTPGNFTLLDKSAYLGEGDEYKLILEGSGNMGDLGAWDENGDPSIAYAWQYTSLEWYLGNIATPIIPYVTSVAMDEKITSIGKGAFCGSTFLERISMPNITKIDPWAFGYCYNLKSLTIPDNVTKIDLRAFYGCSGMKQLTIGEKVKTIGWKAFNEANGLERIYIKGTLNTIDDEAFLINSPNTWIYVKDEATKEKIINSGISSTTHVEVQ